MNGWTEEKKQRLLELVLNEPKKEAALKKAAEELDISFYAVRNQYYTLLGKDKELSSAYVRKQRKSVPIPDSISAINDELTKSAKTQRKKKEKISDQVVAPIQAEEDKKIIAAEEPIPQIDIALSTELKPTSLDDTLIVLAKAVAKEIQTYRSQVAELSAQNAELIKKVDTESKDFSAFEEMIAAEEKKNMELEAEVLKLQQEITYWKSKYTTLEEDYNVISRVIRLAREMTAKEELGSRPKETFKMDNNGNLERLRPKNSFWNEDELEPGAVVL